jgi:hypothetical protein
MYKQEPDIRTRIRHAANQISALHVLHILRKACAGQAVCKWELGWLGYACCTQWSSSAIHYSRRVGRFLDDEPSSYQPQYEKTHLCQAQGSRLLRWHRTNHVSASMSIHSTHSIN